MGNKYIFVVCGGDEHIHTLNFSLQYLKHFTTKEIVVLTDTSRNNITIQHDNIVDVNTPKHFDHHQASIYLKTGIHKFIPPSKDVYCYLDTDIITVRQNCDTIFDQYNSPISFCTDHCKMRNFSPSAIYSFEPNTRNFFLYKQLRKSLDRNNKKFEAEMQTAHYIKWKNINDELYEDVKKERNELQKELKKLLDYYNEEERKFHIAKSKYEPFHKAYNNIELSRNKISEIKTHQKNPFKYISILYWILVRVYNKMKLKNFGKNENIPKQLDFQSFFRSKGFIWNDENRSWSHESGIDFSNTSHELFWNSKGYTFDQEKEVWIDSDGNEIFNNDYVRKLVEEETGLIWKNQTNSWVDIEGEIIQSYASNDLKNEILKQFDVYVSDPDWQHWNGGVFLFNEDSIPFLDNWHDWTLNMFEEPKWFTRDQGTLIATVWKMNLQNHPTLSVKFNFIADYYHSSISYKGDFNFDINTKRKNISPYFIHIYHQFGNPDWKLWQDVESLLSIKYQP